METRSKKKQRISHEQKSARDSASKATYLIANLTVESPMEITENILSKLNDDCLIKLFEHLPLRDLCTAADVCRKFTSIAVAVFRRHNVVLDLNDIFDEFEGDTSYTMCNWENISSLDKNGLGKDRLNDDSVDEDSVDEDNFHGFDKNDLDTDGFHGFDKNDLDTDGFHGFDENDLDTDNLDSIQTIAVGTSSPSRIQTIERLFRHFGIHIQSICMRLDDYEDDEEETEKNAIFKLMSKYCTQEDARLKKLILHDTSISAEIAQRFQPLFDQLKSLDVTGGSVSFDIGAELTEMMLEDVSLNEVGISKLNKLQTLSLIDIKKNCFGRRGPCRMSMMLLPHLKRLTIMGECYHHIFMDNLILCAGITQLLELEELKLDVEFDPRNMENVRNLARLQHLKVFDLNCRWYSITELLRNFVEQNVQIGELHLRKILIGQTSATYLAKLCTIQKLCLSDGGWNFGDECTRLADMVKGMPMLQKLYLCDFGSISIDGITATIANAPKLSEFYLDFGPPHDDKFVIHEEEFNEICDFIAKRLEYTPLHMRLSGNECKLAVSDHICKKNRVWLDVQIISVNIVDIETINAMDDDSDGSVYNDDINEPQAE